MGYHLFSSGQKSQGVHFLSQAGDRASSFGTKVDTSIRSQHAYHLHSLPSQKSNHTDSRFRVRMTGDLDQFVELVVLGRVTLCPVM